MNRLYKHRIISLLSLSLAILVIGGCTKLFGIDISTGVSRSGSINYVMNHSCMREGLEKIPEVIEINYSTSERTHDEKTYTKHKYSYLTSNSKHEKHIHIETTKEITLFHHSVFASLFSDESQKKVIESIENERQIMYKVEEAVGHACSINYKEAFAEYCWRSEKCNRPKIKEGE